MPFDSLAIGSLEAEYSSECPSGYADFGGVCIVPVIEEVSEVVESAYYDFIYREIGGDLIGSYSFGMVGDLGDGASVKYFDQLISVSKSKKFNYVNIPATGLDEGVLTMRILMNTDEDSSVISAPKNSDGVEDSSVVFGEFFLLGNSAQNIHSISVDVTVVDVDGNELDLGVNHKTYEEEMVRWRMGVRQVETYEYPGSLIGTSRGSIQPTMDNPISGTDLLRWETTDPSCYSWIDIHDNMDPREELANLGYTSGRFILQFRAEVDVDVLQDVILAGLPYMPLNGNEYKYDIIFHPPSFRMLQMDVMERAKTPYISSRDKIVPEIIFETTPRYSTDGNMQYTLSVVRGKSDATVLFQTSSYGGDSTYESGSWFWSTDGSIWDIIRPGLPTFNNTFSTENGSDTEQAMYIKYIPTLECHATIDHLATVFYVVEEIDGTLK